MPRLDQEGFPTKPQPILTEGTYTSPNPSLLYQAGIPTQPILTRRAQPIPMGCQPILTRRAQPIPMVCQPILTSRVFPRISVVLNILTHPDQEGIPPIPVVWVGGVGWGGRKTRGGGEMISVAAAPTQSSPGRYPSYHPILTKGLILFLRLLAKEISSSPQ